MCHFKQGKYSRVRIRATLIDIDSIVIGLSWILRVLAISRSSFAYPNTISKNLVLNGAHLSIEGDCFTYSSNCFIKEKYCEQKMSAEYELELTKIIELENKFTKDFSKGKWRKYFNLDLAIGELHSIEIEQFVEFIINILYN